MWVRSQDKTKLINANEIFIKSIGSEHIIRCTTQSVDMKIGWNMGQYITEDRYIEILNEIQKELMEYNSTLSGQCFIKCQRIRKKVTYENHSNK